MKPRIALIGMKGHQSLIFRGLAKGAEAEIVAAAAENEDALNAMKTRPGVSGDAVFYSDWRELVENEEFDIGSICTTNS